MLEGLHLNSEPIYNKDKISNFIMNIDNGKGQSRDLCERLVKAFLNIYLTVCLTQEFSNHTDNQVILDFFFQFVIISLKAYFT